MKFGDMHVVKLVTYIKGQLKLTGVRVSISDYLKIQTLHCNQIATTSKDALVYCAWVWLANTSCNCLLTCDEVFTLITNLSTLIKF